MKTYKVQTKCNNCNEWFKSTIPKGVTVETFRDEHQTVECSKCNCDTHFGGIL